MGREGEERGKGEVCGEWDGERDEEGGRETKRVRGAICTSPSF